MDVEGDSVIIRTLNREDTARLVRMDQEIGGRTRHAWYEGKMAQALKDTDVVISLGAEMDGTLVGALMGSVRFGEFGIPEPIAVLDTILVDGRYRGRRIGLRMMDQLLKNLRGLRVSCLRTEVGWDELELLGFFRRVGFAPAPRLVLEIDPALARLAEEDSA
jgi:predicted N-acetyltransferase YhbS